MFPDVKIEEGIDDQLVQAVKKTCKENNVHCTDYFLEKISQIFKQMQIRTGVMLIGEPFGGKTTMYRMLAKALGILAESDGQSGGNVQIAGAFCLV